MNLPYVSAIIVSYNEINYIEKCFNSLLKQTYPKNKYEIIIVDGISNDGTFELIEKMVQEVNKEFAELRISVFTNSKQNLASGWNKAIRKSKGDYVVRIDAHAYAEEDFLEKSINTILEVTDACCVGGTINTVSDTYIGSLIVKVLSSPFGVGNSKFRYLNEPAYVDTVAYGMYKKEIFKTVGYFDEDLDRTQDNDLHRKIRSKGGKFFLDPSIKTNYFSRNTVSKLAKQARMNGKWTMINFRRRPGKMAIRHFIPFVFFMSIIMLTIFGFKYSIFHAALIAILVLYFLLANYFSFKKTKSITEIILMTCLFFILHISYGFGSFIGLFVKINSKSGD